MEITFEEDEMTDEKALPDQPEHMSEEEFLHKLHEIVPEGARAVTARQAAQIWNLRVERVGKPARYTAHSVRGRLRDSTKSGKHDLRKLTLAQQRSVLGSVIPHIDFLWLDEVLKVPLVPGQSIEKPRGRKTVQYELLDTFIAEHFKTLNDVVHAPTVLGDYARECQERGLPALSYRTFYRRLARHREAMQHSKVEE